MPYEGKVDLLRLMTLVKRTAEPEPDGDWIEAELHDLVRTPVDAFMVAMSFTSYVGTVCRRKNPKSDGFYSMKVVRGEHGSPLVVFSQMVVAYMNGDIDICSTIAQTRCLGGEEAATDLVCTALRCASGVYRVMVRDEAEGNKGRRRRGKAVIDDGGESVAFE